jgi:hypothetical protein
MGDAIKFPKTPRLTSLATEDIYEAWKHARVVVVEEKVDGANVGIWFEEGEIRLQSRGHILRGGLSERQFAPFHGWAAERVDALRDALGCRYVLYGEWCFAKHKAYYDALPDWLLGYDVFDRERERFLGVAHRDDLLAACDVVVVSCLWSGPFGKAPAFGSFIGKSFYKTPAWRSVLAEEAKRVGITRPMDETDDSDWMEGVYVRVEDAQGIIGRMKAHREGYAKVRNDHWRNRPLLRNRLVRASSIDLQSMQRRP